MFWSRTAFLAACILLPACTALNFMHDPESGLITRALVPKVLQSVRCELITFYDVNELRSARFAATVKTNDYPTAVGQYSYFPLDTTQLSGVFLDLKVMDSLGIPSGASATTINRTYLSNAGVDKRTWHVGPTASDTNTYELNWPFVIAQSSTLDLTHHEGLEKEPFGGDYFPCYHNLPPKFGGPPGNHNLEDVTALARHQYPETENFNRIFVDGTEPLAAWILDRSAQLDTALFSQLRQRKTDAPNDERMFPAQMIYTFTVQFGFGADASLSLITATWTPIGLDVSASTQQTSMLTMYINGFDAANANGAKSGIVAVSNTSRQGIGSYGLGPNVVPNAKPNCPASVCSGGVLQYPLPINPQ